MPTARPPRRAVTRAVSTAVLLLSLTGCSSPGGGAGQESAAATAEPSATATTESVEQACARVLDTVRTAPQQLREDPAGLFEEVDELVASAPEELVGRLTGVRDAVQEFRQGDRSLLSVVREITALQESCSG